MKPDTWDAAARETAVEVCQGDAPTLDQLAVKVGGIYEDRQWEAAEAGSPHLSDDSPTLADKWLELGQAAVKYAFSVGAVVNAEQLAKVLVNKQHDYGHGNILAFGHTGVAVRAHDKIARLKNLTAKGLSGHGTVYAARNESFEDSIVDLIGYCVIGVMLADGTFQLPLASDLRETKPDVCNEGGHGA